MVLFYKKNYILKNFSCNVLLCYLLVNVLVESYASTVIQHVVTLFDVYPYDF